MKKRFSLKRYEGEDEKYNDLKFLSRQYNQIVSIRVKAKIQFNNLLDEIMPGISKILTRTTDNSSKILYNFVEKYEHFDNIKRKGEQKFIKEYSAWSKRKDTVIEQLKH